VKYWFNCDKVHHASLTPDIMVLNSLMYIDHLSVSSYTLIMNL